MDHNGQCRFLHHCLSSVGVRIERHHDLCCSYFSGKLKENISLIIVNNLALHNDRALESVS